jgi:hypothetical protein
MKREAVNKVTEFNTDAEKCAKEIISFLMKHHMWIDTSIYVNGKRYGCYDGEHYQYDNTWDCVFREDNMDPKDYVEYTSDFLTMTFEGPFYDAINYNISAKYSDKIMKEFDKIISKYNKYYELGYAWSLALYNV